MADFARTHLQEAARIISMIDVDRIEAVVAMIADLRARSGRLFFLGVGDAPAMPRTR